MEVYTFGTSVKLCNSSEYYDDDAISEVISSALVRAPLTDAMISFIKGFDSGQYLDLVEVIRPL
jgi:hypothetical protein